MGGCVRSYAPEWMKVFIKYSQNYETQHFKYTYLGLYALFLLQFGISSAWACVCVCVCERERESTFVCVSCVRACVRECASCFFSLSINRCILQRCKTQGQVV